MLIQRFLSHRLQSKTFCQQVFIKGLRDASPPIIDQSRLPIFLNEVFGNLSEILNHHQRMLGALFARQRDQHPLIQSVADIILDSSCLLPHMNSIAHVVRIQRFSCPNSAQHTKFISNTIHSLNLIIGES